MNDSIPMWQFNDALQAAMEREQTLRCWTTSAFNREYREVHDKVQHLMDDFLISDDGVVLKSGRGPFIRPVN